MEQGIVYYIMAYLIEGDFDPSALALTNEGSVALLQPSDDNDPEVDEGYILLLDVEAGNVHPSDANRIQFLNRHILITIEDDDSKSQ